MLFGWHEKWQLKSGGKLSDLNNRSKKYKKMESVEIFSKKMWNFEFCMYVACSILQSQFLSEF